MRSQNFFRLAAWLLLCVVGVFTLSPIEFRPVTQAPISLEHFGAFALIGAIFCYVYPKHRYAILISILVVLGLLEIVQNYIPGRHSRLSDALVKAFGALLGAAFTVRISRRKRRGYRLVAKPKKSSS